MLSRLILLKVGALNAVQMAELASRAIAMLAILTGNVGINGAILVPVKALTAFPFVRMPTLTNPVTTSISMFMWTDAILRGPEMTAT